MQISGTTTTDELRTALDGAVARAARDQAGALEAANFASPHPTDTLDDRREWRGPMSDWLDDAHEAERAGQQAQDARQALEAALEALPGPISGDTTIDELRGTLAEELRRATADHDEAEAVARLFPLPPVPGPDDPVDPADPDGWHKHQRWLRSEIELTEANLHRVLAAWQALEQALAKIATL
jgi:hypothetical protein